MENFKYTLNEIFDFSVGTKFQDEDGNVYKVYQDKEHYSKTLKYSIMTEKLLHSRFKIIN